MSDEDPIQPRVVWLSPFCEGCSKHCGTAPEEGQLWCTEPQDDCPECGLGWTRYAIDGTQAAEVRTEHMAEAVRKLA